MAALFGRYELYVQRTGGDPLVVLGLFRKRAFTGGLVVVLLVYGALVGLALIVSGVLQLGFGFSPFMTAVTSLPQAIGSMCALFASRIPRIARLGRTLIHLGLAGVFIGVVGLWFTLHSVQSGPSHESVHAMTFAPALFAVGLGMGLTLAAIFRIVLAAVDPHETGSASGVFTAVQQFGGSLGAAVLGTLFFSAGEAGRQTLTGSAMRTVWVVAGFLLVAFLLARLLPRQPRPPGPPGPPGPPVAEGGS